MALTNVNYHESVTERERIKIMLRELEEDEVRKRTESSVEGIYLEPRKLLDLTVDDDRETMGRKGDITKNSKTSVKPSNPTGHTPSIININQQKNKPPITSESNKNLLTDEIEKRKLDKSRSFESVFGEMKPDKPLMDEPQKKELDKSRSFESIFEAKKPDEPLMDKSEKKEPNKSRSFESIFEAMKSDEPTVDELEEKELDKSLSFESIIEKIKPDKTIIDELEKKELDKSISAESIIEEMKDETPDTLDMDIPGELNQIADTVSDPKNILSEYMGEADSADAYTRAKTLLDNGQTESGTNLLEEIGLKSYHIRYTVMACLELISQSRKNICDFLDQVILKENNIYERLRNISKDKE